MCMYIYTCIYIYILGHISGSRCTIMIGAPLCSQSDHSVAGRATEILAPSSHEAVYIFAQNSELAVCLLSGGLSWQSACCHKFPISQRLALWIYVYIYTCIFGFNVLWQCFICSKFGSLYSRSLHTLTFIYDIYYKILIIVGAQTMPHEFKGTNAIHGPKPYDS